MPKRTYEFLAIITARGGSKGIPRKNIRKIAGKPLIEYTFEAVRNSKLINRCIVSTDSDEIINYSKSEGIEVPFKRPNDLATDESLSIDVLIHALNYLKDKENYIPDYVITLQPTTPLRTGEDIDNAIKIILNDNDADSLVSGVEVPHRYIPHSLMQFKGKYIEHYIKEIRIYRRQEKPNFYARNGAAIYISKNELIMKEKKIIGNKCLPYFMPKERSIDIDDAFDWEIAKCFLRKISESKPL